jgi:hypothetical protein
MATSGLRPAARRARVQANLRGAVFGTITGAAVIAATSAHEDSLQTILIATSGTLVVFWLAHVYEVILEGHHAGTKLTRNTIWLAVLEELPVVEAPLPSVLLLALGALGVLGYDAAVNLALWLAAAQLVVWSVVAARRQKWSWVASAVFGAISGAFGIGIIALKALLH